MPPPQLPKSTNPKDAIGSRKPALSLVPGAALVAMAEVFKLGAHKYGRYNWRDSSVAASVYVDAALRHLYSWFDGQDYDAESGESHIAHAAACLCILLDARSLDMMVDDRPTEGNTALEIELNTRG